MARLKSRVDKLRRQLRRREARGCAVCSGHGRLCITWPGSENDPTPCPGCGQVNHIRILEDDKQPPEPRGSDGQSW